jgi:hypothetical protein
VRAGA